MLPRAHSLFLGIACGLALFSTLFFLTLIYALILLAADINRYAIFRKQEAGRPGLGRDTGLRVG